ncbi:MAG: enoyl-CoA hydratase-related protein [Ilumatobacteraceae bacterium]
MSQLVRSETVGGIATITLDSAHNRNALSATLLEQLTLSLDAAIADDAVRVVVLTGAGNTFCAGADLKDPPGNAPGQRFGFPSILQSIATGPKPVVARINGHVRAGGMGLVAACDIAVAPDDATFAFSEVRIGVIPAIIAVVCQPVMTPRAFRRYAITGAVFDGAEAARNGLVTMAVPRDGLDAAVAAAAEDLRLAAPGGIARCKSLIDELPRKPIDEQWTWTAGISAVQFQEPDAVEGIAAFREKRTPSWAQ